MIRPATLGLLPESSLTTTPSLPQVLPRPRDASRQWRASSVQRSTAGLSRQIPGEASRRRDLRRWGPIEHAKEAWQILSRGRKLRRHSIFMQFERFVTYLFASRCCAVNKIGDDEINPAI